MSDKTKVLLISMGNTFIGAFLTAGGLVLSTGSIEWTTAFWMSVLLAGVRAGVAEVLKKYTPVHLGGKKVK